MDQGKPSQMKRGDVRGPMGAGVRKSGSGMNVLGTFLRVCGEGQLRRGVAVSALRNQVSRQACVDSSSGNVGFEEGRQERDSLHWSSRQGLASLYLWSQGCPCQSSRHGTYSIWDQHLSTVPYYAAHL